MSGKPDDGYEWVPGVELPEIVSQGISGYEPSDEEIEELIGEFDELAGGCCQCGVPLFEEWWEDNQDLIEDDFEDLDFTQKLLVKDWLVQAFEAGRGG